VIPVIDLLEGQVVHAIRGERKYYAPIKSILCSSPDPAMVALSFRDNLGLNDVYIADLNAIQGSGRTHHRRIAALAGNEKISIMLDTGISVIKQAEECLDLGVRKAVIGSETLRSFTDLGEFPIKIGRNRLTFSLDMRNGQIIAACPRIRAMSPLEMLRHLRDEGWQESILLDLGRVGTGTGFDRRLLSEARAAFPDIDLLVGGGISGPEQMTELQDLGAAGVLIATAFHTGVITAQHIRNLEDTKTQRHQER